MRACLTLKKKAHLSCQTVGRRSTMLLRSRETWYGACRKSVSWTQVSFGSWLQWMAVLWMLSFHPLVTCCYLKLIIYLRVGICDLLHHYSTWYDLAEHWCSLITNQACTANSEYAVAFFQGKHTDVDEIHAFVCGSSVCSISWKLSDHAYLVQC